MTGKAPMEIAAPAPAVDLQQTQSSFNGMAELRFDENDLVTKAPEESVVGFAAHSLSFVRFMEENQKKKELTFGEFIANVFDTYGKQKGGWIVCLAVTANLVEFSKPRALLDFGETSKRPAKVGSR